MMTAKLEHPWGLLRRSSKKGDVVEVLAEHIDAKLRPAEWRTVAASGRRPSISRGRRAVPARWTIAVVSARRAATVGHLEDFIGFHDLLDLLEPSRAKHGCD